MPQAVQLGASLGTLFVPAEKSSLFTVLSMLLFDIFFWTGVGWYLENVLPKEFGVRLPWYFIFQSSFWTGKETAEEQNPFAALLGSSPACCCRCCVLW